MLGVRDNPGRGGGGLPTTTSSGGLLEVAWRERGFGPAHRPAGRPNRWVLPSARCALRWAQTTARGTVSCRSPLAAVGCLAGPDWLGSCFGGAPPRGRPQTGRARSTTGHPPPAASPPSWQHPAGGGSAAVTAAHPLLATPGGTGGGESDTFGHGSSLFWNSSRNSPSLTVLPLSLGAVLGARTRPQWPQHHSNTVAYRCSETFFQSTHCDLDF